MKKEKKIVTPRKRKAAAIRPLLSQKEIEAFVMKLSRAGAIDVLLPFVLIIEDLLRDEEIGAPAWQAAAGYLVKGDRNPDLKNLMSRVARAMRQGAEGRQAARRAVMAILERGYDWYPVRPAFRTTAEPVLVDFLVAETLPARR